MTSTPNSVVTDEQCNSIIKLLHDSQWSIGYNDRLRAAALIRKLMPYRAELLKIATQLGENTDPFATWEKIAALSQPTGCERKMREALEAIAPHLKLSSEPQVSDCVLRSRSQELRRQAEVEESYEHAVWLVRQALSTPSTGCSGDK